jgi:hypothetical protein
MRKLFSLMLMLLTIQLSAQSYPVTGIIISLPQNPDASTVKWAGGGSMLTISARAELIAGRVEDRVRDSRILVSVKKSGSKVCGSYSANSAPASNFSSGNKIWNGSNAISLLGQDCILPPGDYELSVQFFGQGPAGNVALSEEKSKAFSIRANEQQSFQPPQAISPANGIVLSEADFKKPLTFRWTPVIPKPQESVTYRLRVWQLMEGQSIGQAIKQQPILGNDVGQYGITQATVIVQLTQPVTYPSLVWNVQALNRNGNPIGENNGTSEAFVIVINPVNDQPSVIHLLTPANKSVIELKGGYKFSWSHEMQQAGPMSIYKIRIVEIKGNQSPGDAMRTNKPHFEKDSIEDRMFFWPVGYSDKDLPEHFAWQVTGYRVPAYGEVKPTVSEVFTFNTKTGAASTGLKLLTPANGRVFSDNETPRFAWTDTSQNTDGDGPYKIKIFELKENETTKACCTNKPFFEKDSLIRPTFEYPVGAPAFEKGKKYAWFVNKINRGNGGVKIKESEINEFSFKSPLTCPNINVVSTYSCLQATNAVNLTVTNPSVTLSVTSWTVQSPNGILINNSGTQLPTGTFMPMTAVPGNVSTINTGQTINSSTVHFLPPNNSTTVTLIYAFHLSNGQICEVETFITYNPVCAGNAVCNCQSWGPVTYKYYPYGNNPPQLLQANLVNDTASITIMQGSKIWPQGGFNCVGNCTSYFNADLVQSGNPIPILTNTGPGNVFEYVFNCGDYLLTLHPYCGPAATPCAPAYVKIHVDCSIACSCGQWNPVMVKAGTGLPVTVPCDNIAAPVQLLFTDAISISATINCITTGAGCFATQSADIYNSTNNLIYSNLPLPLNNWMPPPNLCGQFKIVLKGKCNNISCPTQCTIYFNRACPPPPPTCSCSGWNAIPYTSNGVAQTPVSASGIIAGNAGNSYLFSPTYNCNPAAACPQTPVTYTIMSNGNVVGSANRPVTTPTGSLTAGIYQISFSGSCGTSVCASTVTININPCQCAGWVQTAWSNNGTPQPKINSCGETVHAAAGSNLTFTPAYTCSPVTCSKTPVTYTITQNGNVVGPANRPATTATGILTAGTYVISFTGSCGGAVCTCSVTVIIDAGCSCDGWYKLQYALPGGSMTPVNCAATQTVTIHKQEKIDFIVVGQCQGNCTSSTGVDIFYPGNNGTHPDESLPGGENVNYEFTECGDYRVQFTNSCGDTKCTSCYLKVHVDCSPKPCECNWSGAKIKIGGGTAMNISCTSAAPPIPVSPGVAIKVISADSPCIGEICNSNLSAVIKDANNVILATYSSLGFTYTPPVNYCGILNIVIKGQCGTTQCGDCVIKLDIACCACPATWNTITYKLPGSSVTKLAACNDTLKTTFAQSLNNITASFQCNLPVCVISNLKYKVYGPNNYGLVFLQGNGLTFSFPNTAPCGMYKVVFQGKCGNTTCTCVLYIKVSPGCCEYISTGTHSKQADGNSVKFVSNFAITGAPILFDSVKVQLLWLSINNTIRNNANIVSITKSSGAAWTATQPLAITSGGSAVWFSNATAATATLQLTGKIVGVGALNANTNIQLGLRYTFYRHTPSCGWTICERDFIFYTNK